MCTLPAAGSIGHFLTGCLEWVIEKRKLPQFTDFFVAIKLEYSKQRDTDQLKQLLSRTDYAILDSILLGRKSGPLYDHLSYVDTCINFSVASSLKIYSHLHTSNEKLAFDYLENGSVLFKVTFTKPRQNMEASPKLWPVSHKEILLPIDNPWNKPYLMGLSRLEQGREYLAYLNNYMFFINNTTKRAVYNFKFCNSNTSIEKVHGCKEVDSYFMATVKAGHKIQLKLFSTKIRKPLLSIDIFNPKTQIPATSTGYMTTITQYGKVLVFWNNLLNTIDIYSVARRRLIGHAPIKTKIEGLAQFFVNRDLAIIATGSLVHVFRLNIDASVTAELVNTCPNLLERKCWWNRSIALSEEVRFTACGSNVIIYSQGKTIGMQTVSYKGDTSFVRLFDQPAGNVY
jgi:hypothetical protein